jgi:hypothetical protein
MPDGAYDWAGMGMSGVLLSTHTRRLQMRGLVSLGILLVVLWAVAWLVFKTAGFLIHLVLIVGVIMLIVGLVKRAGRAVSRDV